MQINQISNQQPTFGKLYSGESLKKALNPSTHQLVRKYKAIKNYIRSEKLHKLENVDIILHYSNCDGFYGVISNKEGRIPLNSNNRLYKVNTTLSCLEEFKNWAKRWNNRLVN